MPVRPSTLKTVHRQHSCSISETIKEISATFPPNCERRTAQKPKTETQTAKQKPLIHRGIRGFGVWFERRQLNCRPVPAGPVVWIVLPFPKHILLTTHHKPDAQVQIIRGSMQTSTPKTTDHYFRGHHHARH